MMKYQYFIIETKRNPFPNDNLSEELAFHTSFEIDGRSFFAFDFKQLKLEQEVKNIIFGSLNNNSKEKFQIIPIPKKNNRYRKCDVLYVTNFPKNISHPKQFIEKFCTNYNRINKGFCYCTIKSSREDLERIIHFITSIPIEGFHILASFSCIDFPILRFSNLSLKTTEGALESYIMEHSSCKVVEIKMSKPCQGKNDKYANVLLQPDDNIEEAIKIFNFSYIDDNIIYVKQFLEPDMGREIKKYEITVVDLPKNMNQNTFLKEMSSFGRIFETIFDQESLIGYVVFIFHKSREKLLSSSRFHSYYSLVTILISNFPPNTTCDEVKTYVLNNLKSNKISTDSNDQNKKANNNNNDDDDDENNNSTNPEDFDFDINSIKEIKVYQEQQYLSSDPTQLKSYFTLPTFSITLDNPFLVDLALTKLNIGLYKNIIAPYAIRYYPHSKDNDSERSQILKNLGDSNTIIISPIDPEVTLECLFEICSRFGVILYFQVNQRKVPIYCIVKYQTNESFKNALDDINNSTLNGQQIHTSIFSFEKKITDQNDKSEDSSSSKNSQNSQNSEDYYYDYNNPPPYPPWAIRPMPYPMAYDPRFMMRPFPMFPQRFPMYPPPHYPGPSPMCHPHPCQCNRGPPQPPMEQQQMTSEQQREWEEWCRQWWNWWSRNGHPHHCHHRPRDGRGQNSNETGQKDENPDQMKERRFNPNHCMHFKHRRHCEFRNENGNEGETGTEWNKKCYGRKYRCNKDFRNAKSEQEEDVVCQNESPTEMNQKSGGKWGRRKNRRDFINNEEEEAQNQGRRRREPRSAGCRDRHNNEEEEEASNEVFDDANRRFQRRGPYCRRSRWDWRNYEQKNADDEESNEKGDDSQGRQGRRRPHNWRHRRNWGYDQQAAAEEDSNETAENQQRRDPNCFKGRRNFEEEEDANEPADPSFPSPNQRRRGPKRFRGKGRTEAKPNESEEDFNDDPSFDYPPWRRGRFGRGCGCARGTWWANRNNRRFERCREEDGDDSGQIEPESSNRRDGFGRGGRGCRGCRRGRGRRQQNYEPSQIDSKIVYDDDEAEVEIKEKSENAKTENEKSKNVKTENEKSENVKAENEKSENAKTENEKSENAKTENEKSENAKTENEICKPSEKENNNNNDDEIEEEEEEEEEGKGNVIEDNDDDDDDEFDENGSEDKDDDFDD